ncbi:MAG: type III pantothenate kinase [Chloroflexota bacterium]
MSTLLAVDIGNTNVTLGAFRDGVLQATWRFATDGRRTADEHSVLIDSLMRWKGLDARDMDAAILCSVVPPVTASLEASVRDLCGAGPMLIGRGTRTGIRISYDRPQDVGTDRIVDAVAAYNTYGGPCVVVDLGTATVFDAITSDGEYVGGAISTGMMLSAEALYQHTSQLRRVEPRAPGAAIGRNTAEAMQSGLVYGYVGLVEGMVARFKKELSPDDPGACHVVATGGLARVIAGQSEALPVVDEDLTLQGLRMLHEMNTAPATGPEGRR